MPRQALTFPAPSGHPAEAHVASLAACGVIMTTCDHPHTRRAGPARAVAAELAGTASASPVTSIALASNEHVAGRTQASIDAWRDAIERAERVGDPAALARTQSWLAWALTLAGRLDEAESPARSGLASARASANPSSLALALSNLATVEASRRPDEALALFRDATAILPPGSGTCAMSTLSNPIAAMYRVGRLHDMLRAALEFFELARRLGSRLGSLMHLQLVGLVAADLGRDDLARASLDSLPDWFTGYPEFRDATITARTTVVNQSGPSRTNRMDPPARSMTVTELADLGARIARELLAGLETSEDHADPAPDR